MAADVSIIIVNYDGARWLEGCLSAVRETTRAATRRGGAPLDVEVILVDNASRDESRALAARLFPEVRVVALERNLGFAGGNNAGARAASGEWLVFLNNDTRPRAGWLDALVAAVSDRPFPALASAKLVFMHDTSLIDSAGDGYTRWGGGFKRGHRRDASGYDEPGEVFGVCGAACIIARELYLELGGFDEDFFAVFEDVDLSYRARLAGARCFYAPAAVVEHAGSATLGTVSDRAVYFGQRNLEWVFLKNTPVSLLWRYLPGHLVHVCGATLYFAWRGRLAPFVKAKAAAIGGIPKMWRKRRHIQAARRVTTAALVANMERQAFRVKWDEKVRSLTERA